MKRLVSLFALATLIVIAASSSAYAASKPLAKAPTAAPEYVGYDIAWPQCGKKLPTGHAFGIVGVNGGTAVNTNPCLPAQLKWAATSNGGSKQPLVQLYVNTANPGEVKSTITTWPSNNIDKTGVATANPYDQCDSSNSLACSWQYGWNRSVEADLDRFAPAARTAGISSNAADYVWWLDVETMNTWQTASSADAQARNTAAIEGFAAYYQSKGAKVGLYSTAPQWKAITGTTVSNTSNLNNLPNWRPSGASLDNAKANCSVAPLTAGGFISLTQYIQQNLDKNHSCI